MKVAIGIDGGGFVLAMEGGRCLVPGIEVSKVPSMLGLKVDELDVVFVGHRMWRLTYTDGDGAFLAAFYYRDMILGLAVRGAGFEFFHLVSAAMRYDFGSAHLEHDVAADWATVEDCLHSVLVLED